MKAQQIEAELVAANQEQRLETVRRRWVLYGIPLCKLSCTIGAWCRSRRPSGFGLSRLPKRVEGFADRDHRRQLIK